MHLTILYRDILCDVGKGWFSTRLASEKPALLASFSFVSERSCFSSKGEIIQEYIIPPDRNRLFKRVVHFSNCPAASDEIVETA